MGRREGSLPPDPDKDKCAPASSGATSTSLVLEKITVPVLACVSSSDQDLMHTRGTLTGVGDMSLPNRSGCITTADGNGVDFTVLMDKPFK